MPCFKPIHGFRAKRLNENGKRPIVFNRRDGFVDMPVTVPCGRCIGCRLDKSKQWGIRCTHEASLYENNCFLTLTFNDDCLPKDNSVDLEIFQRFMKRLRRRYDGLDAVIKQKKFMLDQIGKAKQKKFIETHEIVKVEQNDQVSIVTYNDYPIRFFHCGEYGSKKQRPHYHACLFNFDFPDKTPWKVHNGHTYYRSEILESLWSENGKKLGFCLIGDLTFESAAYVARYVTKKITGEAAADWYNDIDYSSGEILSERQPEYATMSRRPGIGKGWYDKFKEDVFPLDEVIIKSKKFRPPKFYEKMFEQEHPMDYAILKNERKKRAELSSDNTVERLQVREQIQERRALKLKRGYEND